MSAIGAVSSQISLAVTQTQKPPQAAAPRVDSDGDHDGDSGGAADAARESKGGKALNVVA